MTDYESPYGKPEGLADRLAEWRRRLGTDKTLPWVGLGLCADIELAAVTLSARPGEAVVLSDPVAEVRAVLIEKGMLAEGDTTTDIAGLLRILL